MDSYKTYLDFLAQKPNERYRSDMQARVNNAFDNTTRLSTLKHEGYPFDFVFETEQEVVVDIVSNTFTNLDKIVGDFRSFQFKDCNYDIKRGQYLIYNEDYYLTYQRTSALKTVAKCKAVKCNNKLKWIDDTNIIREYPVFIGNELSSTNKQVNKDGAIPNGRLVIMTQCNEHTKKIEINQRFVISNRLVCKINEVSMVAMYDLENDEVPMMKLYIEWTTPNSSDDLANNLADYLKPEAPHVSNGLQISHTEPVLSQFQIMEFSVDLYENDILNNVYVDYTVNGDTPIQCYNISRINNAFKLTNLQESDVPLTITFRYDTYEQSIQVKLGGFM